MERQDHYQNLSPSVQEREILVRPLEDSALKINQEAYTVSEVSDTYKYQGAKLTSNQLFPVVWNASPQRTPAFDDLPPLISRVAFRTTCGQPIRQQVLDAVQR